MPFVALIPAWFAVVSPEMAPTYGSARASIVGEATGGGGALALAQATMLAPDDESMGPRNDAWANPSALAPGEVDAVEVPWQTWKALHDLASPPEGKTRPGPWISEREVKLQPVEGGWALDVRWTVVAQRPGWLWDTLAGSTIEIRSTTFEGSPAPVVPLPGGARLGLWVERGGELRLRAFIRGSLDDRIELELMSATRGRLHIDAPGRVPVPVVDPDAGYSPPVLDGGIVWSGASIVALDLRDPSQAPPTRETLAVAHAGVGLTIGDAELRGHAHLQWELRHGSLPRVRASVAGLGDDLVITGRDITTWSRNGDVLEVQLGAPATGRVDLDLRWTQAIPAGDEASIILPRIEPEAWRSEASLQVARDGEHEVIPRPEGWTAVAASALPQWGQGLVEGTPTAAYQRSGGHRDGALDLMRFVPVPGPPTVVDVATYTMATTEEGRVLMRARYELRNDRGAHLTVRPPEGMRIIGARVAGQTALPSRGDDGAWRLPLKRSLETVEGLLSFAVEVTLIGEDQAWARRERRDIVLPTLDAPIAAARATVHLPPGYRNRIEASEHNVVESFDDSDGLTYGVGIGDEASAAADAMFEEAVQGYLSNDFDSAQASLDELERLGVRNSNMARLQSNIDVIEGTDDAKPKGDVTLQRRVKEQAKARAADEFLEQEVLIAEAEKAAEAGDYEEAEASYEAALELGGKLAKLEQTESVEQRSVNTRVATRFKTISKKKAKRGRWRRGVKYKRASTSIAGGSARESDSLTTSFGGGDVMPTDDPAPDMANEAPEEGQVTESAVTGQDQAEAMPTPVTPTAQPVPVEPAVVDEPDDDADEPLEADEAAFADLDRIEPQPDAKLHASEPPARRRRIRAIQAPSRRRAKRSSRRARGGSFNVPTSDSSVSVYDFDDGEAPPPPRDGHGGQGKGGANEALAAPKVTASALSVVIPATGEAVLYQQLLIDANQTQTLTIDARRRLRRR